MKYRARLFEGIRQGNAIGIGYEPQERIGHAIVGGGFRRNYLIVWHD